ncbi:MAG: phage major capsid protein [Betaproteobacteria bacterium]|nr:phage major capsid protein [Betaproteobacteria bacterium]
MTPDGGRWDGSPGNGSAPAGGPLFNAMFPQARGQASREFSDLGDFARAVYERNPRLFQNVSGMGEGVGADGGFYVPTHFFAGLMDSSLQQEAVRPRATIIPMQSSSTVIPMFNLANRSTGIATLEGKLTAEGATGTTQKAALREVTLTAKKISVLVPTTTELLQDAPQVFATMLKDAMTEALAQTLDTWFIGGNGVGCPLGILNAPALVSVAKDSGQVNGTLTPTNISGMVARLAAGSVVARGVAGVAVGAGATVRPDHRHQECRRDRERRRVRPAMVQRQPRRHVLAARPAGGRHRSLPGARHQGRHHAVRPQELPGRAAPERRTAGRFEYRLRGKRDLVPPELPRRWATGAGVGHHPAGQGSATLSPFVTLDAR